MIIEVLSEELAYKQGVTAKDMMDAVFKLKSHGLNEVASHILTLDLDGFYEWLTNLSFSKTARDEINAMSDREFNNMIRQAKWFKRFK